MNRLKQLLQRRGFLLVTSLFIIIVLLLMGMGFIGSQASRYAAARRSGEAAQARQLALAGLEDARIKLEMDSQFPPQPAVGQPYFSYAESLTLSSSPALRGAYTVLIDRSYEKDPNNVYLITSTGAVGPAEKPIAQYKLIAELDLVPESSGTHARPTPTGGVTAIPTYRTFRYTHIQDEGVP